MAGKPLDGVRAMEYLNIRVTPDTKARLVELARKERRTVSDYVRLVLEDHLRNIGDK